MRRAAIAVTGALLVGAVALLTGCVPESVAPSPTSTTVVSPSPPAPIASPTTSTSSTAPEPTTSPASIPASCDDLGTAATRQQTVGDLTAQHADGFVRPAPANATTDLSCNWIQEEAAAVLLLISTAPDADVTAGVTDLGGQGYQCQAAEDFGAQYCVKSGGTAETEDVVVARDGVWIYLETVNVNARAWLSEIASQIFG
ncbi:MAG: DnaJ-class molecular chaperone [Microbacterium sp.]|nr:DnaJ-class molecular chaperone [Microbacterium sp.]